MRQYLKKDKHRTILYRVKMVDDLLFHVYQNIQIIDRSVDKRRYIYQSLCKLTNITLESLRLPVETALNLIA